jgi:hypothetical protein
MPRKANDEARGKAEAQFARKQADAASAKSGRAQYEAEAKATRDKTERLRALRLAKAAVDARQASAEPSTAQEKPKKPRSARTRT